MKKQKIRVGIIGAGGWTTYGHIPALKILDAQFEIVAISARNQNSLIEVAARFQIKHAFTDAQQLINHPEVDLVVITVPAPQHAEFVKAAIAARKDVYSEWPLTTNTTDSKELLELAAKNGVRHVVGLQRKFAPSARYTRDLIKQNYIGKVRSARLYLSVDAFPHMMPEKYAWTFGDLSFTNVLSVYHAHFADPLFQSVGLPKKLTAVVENQFPFTNVIETGEMIPTTKPDQVMVIGSLENGGLFSAQLEGGQKHRTGLQIDITGTDGVLRISNRLGFQNIDDNLVEGMIGDSGKLEPLVIPLEYNSLPDSHLDASVKELAYLYQAFASDCKNGTTSASSFKDAVLQHELLDLILNSSRHFFKN